MIVARYGHTATLLPIGKLLVAGGASSDVNVSFSALASAELYDPRSGTWTATGKMITARFGQTATLLPNGKVLVAGGYNSSGDRLASAELYDPGSRSWTATGNMVVPRVTHTATLLPNGKVLVAGGFAVPKQNGLGGSPGSITVVSAELYDPSSGSWSATGNMIEDRYSHTATLLPNGKVLVAGGIGHASPQQGGEPLFSAELYDPGTGTWAATGSMAAVRFGQPATLLPNGMVLVAGGSSSFGTDGAMASAELYDPGTGTWTATGSMAAARTDQTAALLPNGKVLVAGGVNATGSLMSAELYDPSNGAWTAARSLIAARDSQTATLLPSGQVLVAGGSRTSSTGIDPLASAELYDPGSGT